MKYVVIEFFDGEQSSSRLVIDEPLQIEFKPEVVEGKPDYVKGFRTYERGPKITVTVSGKRRVEDTKPSESPAV